MILQFERRIATKNQQLPQLQLHPTLIVVVSMAWFIQNGVPMYINVICHMICTHHHHNNNRNPSTTAAGIHIITITTTTIITVRNKYHRDRIIRHMDLMNITREVQVMVVDTNRNIKNTVTGVSTTDIIIPMMIATLTVAVDIIIIVVMIEIDMMYRIRKMTTCLPTRMTIGR
jgi:hypothetical protein